MTGLHDRLANVLLDAVRESGAYVRAGDPLDCTCVDGDVDFTALADAVIDLLLNLAGSGKLLVALDRTYR